MNTQNIIIRLFKESDAVPVSNIICRNLRKVNSKDYSNEDIEHFTSRFTPSKVIEEKESGPFDKIMARGQLVKDKKDGVFTIFHENGKIKDSISYKQGKMYGVRKNWDENGTLRKETFFEDNKLNGSEKIYDKNGILQLERF